MKKLPIVILAGGKATRLYPITKNIPKSLLEFNGKPFLHHQLELLRDNDFTDIHLCLGVFADQILNCVSCCKKNGFNITYSIDYPNLGTGGALNRVPHHLGKYFFVMYGDSYLPNIDFHDMQEKFFTNNADILLSVCRVNNNSNIEFYPDMGLYEEYQALGTIVSYDKSNPTDMMDYSDYGVSILSRNVFDGYSYGSKFDLSRVYQTACKNNNILGYEVYENFYEIGSQEGIEEFQAYLDNMEESKKKEEQYL
jgi:N-acetyl-alpha-D-muramate 1-phosphate uridylyltransferase